MGSFQSEIAQVEEESWSSQNGSDQVEEGAGSSEFARCQEEEGAGLLFGSAREVEC